MVPNPEKVFRHTHARKPGLNVPGGMLPIAEYCWPKTGPDPSTLLRPDFDPLTLTPQWIVDRVRETFAASWPPNPIPLDTRVRQLSDELGSRAAHSWKLRFHTEVMPQAWASEYRRFIYETIGKPEPVTPQQDGEPVLVRTIQHVRWLQGFYRKREAQAMKRRRQGLKASAAVAPGNLQQAAR